MKKVIFNTNGTVEHSEFNHTFTILVSEIEEGKAQVEYFINGAQVTDWGCLDKWTQKQFSIMADVICERENLVKWSY